MNWKALFEAIKEPLRLLVLAVIPFGITYFTSMDYQWAIVATVVLRFLDKWLHEIGKESGNENLISGITRF